MAGSYPNAPDHKIFYNDDGSVLFTEHEGVTTILSAAQAALVNDESNSTGFGWGNGHRAGILFPQLMDIKAFYVRGDLTYSGLHVAHDLSVRTSTNTSNGVDGTWTEQTATATIYGIDTVTDYRSNLTYVDYPGIIAITVSSLSVGDYISGGSLGIYNVYGRPSAGESPDRLRFWQPVIDEEVPGSHFDYANMKLNTTKTIPFRIKNNSAALTAHSIVISDDALTPAPVTLASLTRFSALSTPGTKTASLNIGDLAPGAVSQLLYAHITTTDATVGLWRQRYKAVAGSWS